MKKIIAIALVVVLFAGVTGGFVYAQNPSGSARSSTDMRLVGMGRFGSTQEDTETVTWITGFLISNPDHNLQGPDVTNVHITRQDSAVIYNGPLLKQTVEDGEVVASEDWIEPLEPKEIRLIELWTYFPDPDDPDHDWMSREEALSESAAEYMAEFDYHWWPRPGLPPIGHTVTRIFRSNSTGEVTDAVFRIQMECIKE